MQSFNIFEVALSLQNKYLYSPKYLFPDPPVVIFR